MSLKEGKEEKEEKNTLAHRRREGGWCWGCVDEGVGVEGVNWIHPLPSSPLRNVLQQDIGNMVAEMQ